MIRQWNNEKRCFEVIEENSKQQINIDQVRQIKNLCISIGSFSAIGATLCTMDYIYTRSFSSGLGITLFSAITLGSAIHAFNNHQLEKECTGQAKKKK